MNTMSDLAAGRHPGGKHSTEEALTGHTFPASSGAGAERRPGGMGKQGVLKGAVGTTSSTFIGPACRPPEAARAEPRPNIDQTLEEFYKELEKVESTNSASCIPGEDSGTQPLKNNAENRQLKMTTRERMCPKTPHPLDTVAGQKRPSQPHQVQNEPYLCKRQRPGHGEMLPAVDPSPTHQWQPFPPFHRPPCPSFHRPYGAPPPPPPRTFPRPPPGFMPHPHHTWNPGAMADRPPGGFPFQTNHRPGFPPPRYYNPVSQGFDSPHHLRRSTWGCSYDESDRHGVHWSSDVNSIEPPANGDCDWRVPQNTEGVEQGSRPPCAPSLALILMRGLPGSGKTTRAQELLSTGTNGLILSTDDYFGDKHGYLYDPNLLGAAHEWNQSRAKEAMHNRQSPVIIDNTNIQAWEMKPYVQMALERGYRIYFQEPDTRWKFDPFELEKRNKHGVSLEKIAKMLDRFPPRISIDIVMGSEEPKHVTMREQLPWQPQQWSSHTN